jgi:hypothetical protein
VAPEAAVAFDPVAAWLALPADVQQQIGAAAIAAEIGVLGAAVAVELGVPELARSRENIGLEARSFMFELIVIHLLDGNDAALPPRPDLRPLGIRQCRACGCTDEYACEGGCSWAQEDLCSNCAPGRLA